MASYVDGAVGSYVAAETFSAFARVKFDANGQLVTAGVADKDIGTAEIAALAVGDRIPVRFRNAPGTRKCIAASAVAIGAEVSTAAAGKVNDTAATGSFKYGVAVTAAGADGDIFEVLPNMHGDTAAP